MMAATASIMAPSSLVAQDAASTPVQAVTAAATTSSLLLTRIAESPTPAVGQLFAVRSGAWALNGSLEEALPRGDVRAGPNVALMIVGGAGLVTGLIIGGDGGLIIATGGTVIGLLGLYRYLK